MQLSLGSAMPPQWEATGIKEVSCLFEFSVGIVQIYANFASFQHQCALQGLFFNARKLRQNGSVYSVFWIAAFQEF